MQQEMQQPQLAAARLDSFSRRASVSALGAAASGAGTGFGGAGMERSVLLGPMLSGLRPREMRSLQVEGELNIVYQTVKCCAAAHGQKHGLPATKAYVSVDVGVILNAFRHKLRGHSS